MEVLYRPVSPWGGGGAGPRHGPAGVRLRAPPEEQLLARHPHLLPPLQPGTLPAGGAVQVNTVNRDLVSKKIIESSFDKIRK